MMNMSKMRITLRGERGTCIGMKPVVPFAQCTRRKYPTPKSHSRDSPNNSALPSRKSPLPSWERARARPVLDTGVRVLAANTSI